MAPEFKAFIVALVATPFALAVVGIVMRYGFFGFRYAMSWYDFKFAMTMMVGLSYMLALAYFKRQEKNEPNKK